MTRYSRKCNSYQDNGDTCPLSGCNVSCSCFFTAPTVTLANRQKSDMWTINFFAQHELQLMPGFLTHLLKRLSRVGSLRLYLKSRKNAINVTTTLQQELRPRPRFLTPFIKRFSLAGNLRLRLKTHSAVEKSQTNATNVTSTWASLQAALSGWSY